jgi:hypothetical protein
MNHQNQNPETDILKALTREGVLVNVSVRFWRAHKKLRAQDLGLDPERVSDRLISLGHKRLLPREATAALALVESRVHAFVEANTFPFLGGIARFLPNARLQDTLDRLRDFEAEFGQARDAFLSGYTNERGKALLEWEEAARGFTDSPELLVAAIRESFPDREDLAPKFAFETRLFQIAAPPHLRKELVDAGEQHAVIEARRIAAREARESIRRDAEGFVAECVTGLREQTARLCDEMLESMGGGKTEGVHQKTLNRLVRFIDQFKAMNFADDREMEQRLEQVRSQFLERSAEDYRNSPAAQRDLQGGLTAMRDHANELLQQDAKELVERFGQMGRRKLQLAG